MPARLSAPAPINGNEPDFVGAGRDGIAVTGETEAEDSGVIVGRASSGRVVVAVLILF